MENYLPTEFTYKNGKSVAENQQNNICKWNLNVIVNLKSLDYVHQGIEGEISSANDRCSTHE
jgi:hypothetical protein